MARPIWKRTNQLVEAEQLTPDNVPEGVEVNRVGLTTKLCYTMPTNFGRVLVPLGTWIVYDEEGIRPVPQRVFERVFRPVSVAGRAVAFGMAGARKIIGVD